MSDSERETTTAEVHSPEYLEAEVRVQHWATTLGREVPPDEFEKQFQIFHDEEKNKAQMKTRSALIREKAKAEAELKKLQKKMKSPPPAKQSTSEAMGTDAIIYMTPPLAPCSIQLHVEAHP